MLGYCSVDVTVEPFATEAKLQDVVVFASTVEVSVTAVPDAPAPELPLSVVMPPVDRDAPFSFKLSAIIFTVVAYPDTPAPPADTVSSVAEVGPYVVERLGIPIFVGSVGQ